MQKILVTGANGFVGNYLSGLLSLEYEVIATGKGESRLFFAHPQLSYQSLDITSEAEVINVIRKVNPDVIVHSAAMSKPDECEVDRERAYLTNVEATRYLLQAAEAAGSSFIFLSTDFIFDGKKGNYREEDEPAPVNYYGETKRLAEELVTQFSGPWAIVRTVLVYGDPKSGRQNILTSMASLLRNGKRIKIFHDQVRTPTYVEDLVWAIKAIIDQKKQGVFHISGKDVLTPYEMVVATATLLNLDESLIEKVTASEFEQPAARPPKTGFDLSKAARELGYEPISFEEGLRKTFLV